MANPLTNLERRILDYLIDYLRENTFQPSVREIGERFGIRSTKTVTEILQSLSEKGAIERVPARSRGVKILNLALRTDAMEVPYYGKVAAGEEGLDPSGVTARVALDRSLAPGENVFFLGVVGDSMRERGVLDGDLVLVDPIEEQEVTNGTMVAAQINGDAVVKEYFRENGRCILRSASPEHGSIDPEDSDDFRLLGRVVGLYRRVDAAESAASIIA